MRQQPCFLLRREKNKNKKNLGCKTANNFSVFFFFWFFYSRRFVGSAEEPTRTQKIKQQTFGQMKLKRGWKRLSQCLVTHTHTQDRATHTPIQASQSQKDDISSMPYAFSLFFFLLLCVMCLASFNLRSIPTYFFVFIFVCFFPEDVVDTNRRRTEINVGKRGRHTPAVREKVFIGALSARRLDYPEEGRRRRRQHEK